MASRITNIKPTSLLDLGEEEFKKKIAMTRAFREGLSHRLRTTKPECSPDYEREMTLFVSDAVNFRRIISGLRTSRARSMAGNPTTPIISELLLHHSDERVRALVAERRAGSVKTRGRF